MKEIQEVILVNEKDVPLGNMEKMEAHRKGLLHRAFSVFIFNSRGELLLQQRALNKYHSAGLWTNTCCSHPRPGEETIEAASRRLQEEMGFATGLTKIFDFTYFADFENGLKEHEYDHVYAGTYDGIINADKEEINEYCFKSMVDIESSLQSHPSKYTSWFSLAFPKVMAWYNKNYLNTIASLV